VVIQTAQKRFITDFSLKFLEQNLDPDSFFRCHRSYIVRLDAIESIAPWGAGTYRLILDRESDLGVPLARARATELKALIPWSANVFED
jgi:DNA-binding LytR/AlgR family response regulator